MKKETILGIIYILGIFVSISLFFIFANIFVGTFLSYISLVWFVPMMLFLDLLARTKRGSKIKDKIIDWLKS